MNALITSVLVYILLIISIYSFKPQLCFRKDGKMKSFGIGKNKTPFTFLSISIILGVFSFVIATLYNEYITPTVEDIIEEATEIVDTAKNLINSN